MRLHSDRDITRLLNVPKRLHGLAVLRKGIDPRKDQSYFLFSLRQEQLLRALTPLGRMAKSEIRAIARKLGLKVADKADSQEICFVPGQDYKAFLRSHLGENQFHRGGIYDLEGNFIAAHEGIEMFTIGQRKGLPGGSAQPRYVVDLDPETNRVIVGSAEDLLVEEFEVERVNWISVAGVGPSRTGGICGPGSLTPATTPMREATVKIRYNHRARGDSDAVGTAPCACSSMRTAKGDYAGAGCGLLRW